MTSLVYCILCVSVTPFAIVSSLLERFEQYDDELNRDYREIKHRSHYFAYGSDMPKSRISATVANVTFMGPAVLKNYRLDFDMQQDMWSGAVATICPEPGSEVWGVIWEMSKDDAAYLSKTKDTSVYTRKNVVVRSPSNKEFLAFTFIAKVTPRKLPPWRPLPLERRPSSTYLKMIVDGATQGGLPLTYIKNLYEIPDNGKVAVVPMRRSSGAEVLNDGAELSYNFALDFKIQK